MDTDRNRGMPDSPALLITSTPALDKLARLFRYTGLVSSAPSYRLRTLVVQAAFLTALISATSVPSPSVVASELDVVPPETENELQDQLPETHPTVPTCIEPGTDTAIDTPECDDWVDWKIEQEAERPDAGETTPGYPSQPQPSILFPVPPSASQGSLKNAGYSFFAIADHLLRWIGGDDAQAATSLDPTSAALTSWSGDDLLPPPDHPPYLGARVYGKYDAASNTYFLRLEPPAGVAIGDNTSLMLDTDQDAATGLSVGSGNLGADYAINVVGGKPHLYAGSAGGANLEWVGEIGDLYNEKTKTTAYSLASDGSHLEIALPASTLGVTAASQSIRLVGDLNEAVAFPTVYANGYFTLPGVVSAFPIRTDFNKRAAMVFCEATQALFWKAEGVEQTDAQRKAYSQLYMAMQHQSMMAGIPFDLISVSALNDVANVVNYDALVLPFCADVSAADRDTIDRTLYQAVYHYGIGLITADDLLTNDENRTPFSGDAYRYMAQLMGITRVDGGGPATTLKISAAADGAHPAMRGYAVGDVILELPGFWWNYYTPLVGQEATTLANQTIDGSITYPAVLATETGGRNVHFSSIELLGNTNLAWQALHWVLYGEQIPVGLKMGRGQAVFAARNDMDQSMFRAPPTDTTEPADGVVNVDAPLLEKITAWKQTYDFVGSYYINIGNAPDEGEWTDWTYSGPLYAKYVVLGSEIGTHSTSHPDDTNEYDAEQHPTGYQATDGVSWSSWLKVQFQDSMDEILANVSPTWLNVDSTLLGSYPRGGAVPGMPESLEAAQNILTAGRLDYLTGGYAGVGAGFPNAIGYLVPPSAALSAASSKVYFSPNMYFDFTLIEWGLPNGQLTAVPEGSTAASGHTPIPATCSASSTVCAESVWPEQYLELLTHASQPVVVWPWHDYGPTTSSQGCTSTVAGTHCYSEAMYTNVIATARNTGAEFVTLIDAAERIATLKDAELTVSQPAAGQVEATVAPSSGGSLGKFALQLRLDADQLISSVDGWYAYGKDKVFLPTAGGHFVARIGAAQDAVTHLSQLPMRAELTAVSGDGTKLEYGFVGEGTVEIQLAGAPSAYEAILDGAFATTAACGSGDPNCISVTHSGYGAHSGSVGPSAPSASVSASSLSFGSQYVSYSSPAQILTLNNSGIGHLRIDGIATGGDFAQTNDCAGLLAEGATCRISVTFKPTAVGGRNGTLTVTSNDSQHPSLTVPLNGTGMAAPIASLSATSLNFSALKVGATSLAQTLTLSNRGTGSLTISGINLSSSDFAQTNRCPAALSGGQSCTIQVTFKPTAGGARTGTLNVVSNDPARATLSVGLSGTGLVPPAAPANPKVSCSSFLIFFANCKMTWSDASSDEQGFRVQYATNSAFSSGLTTATVRNNTVSYTTGMLSRRKSYWFRVQSYNSVGTSANVAATPSPVVTP